GDDLELLDAVVPVAGIDGHLPHGQALGVAAVLLPTHPAWFVGTLPDDDIAVRSALHRPAAHALRLPAGKQLEVALAQFAGEEVVVEQGVGDDHVAGLERTVQLAQQRGLAGALAGVRRHGHVVAGARRQRQQDGDPGQWEAEARLLLWRLRVAGL